MLCTLTCSGISVSCVGFIEVPFLWWRILRVTSARQRWSLYVSISANLLITVLSCFGFLIARLLLFWQIYYCKIIKLGIGVIAQKDQWIVKLKSSLRTMCLLWLVLMNCTTKMIIIAFIDNINLLNSTKERCSKEQIAKKDIFDQETAK